MDNHTVVQLKVIAKERGIRGYYKLRKEELINAFEAEILVEQISSIFDESNDPTPVLQPTPWRPSNITTKVKQNKKNSLQKACKRSKLLVIGYWIYIPPKPKVVDEGLESFKNLIKKLYENRDTLFNQHSPNLR